MIRPTGRCATKFPSSKSGANRRYDSSPDNSTTHDNPPAIDHEHFLSSGVDCVGGIGAGVEYLIQTWEISTHVDTVKQFCGPSGTGSTVINSTPGTQAARCGSSLGSSCDSPFGGPPGFCTFHEF